jgi:hypothetical protein
VTELDSDFSHSFGGSNEVWVHRLISNYNRGIMLQDPQHKQGRKVGDHHSYTTRSTYFPHVIDNLERVSGDVTSTNLRSGLIREMRTARDGEQPMRYLEGMGGEVNQA